MVAPVIVVKVIPIMMPTGVGGMAAMRAKRLQEILVRTVCLVRQPVWKKEVVSPGQQTAIRITIRSNYQLLKTVPNTSRILRLLLTLILVVIWVNSSADHALIYSRIYAVVGSA